MAHRRRPAVKSRPARKKKNNPTVAIILFVGIGFLAIAAGVYFVSTQKAPKVATKKRPQQVDVEGEEFSRPEPTSKPKSKPQPVAPRPEPKPDPKTDFSPVFNPASLNRLPLAVALPEDERPSRQKVFPFHPTRIADSSSMCLPMAMHTT